MDEYQSPLKENLENMMEIAVVVKENGDFWLVHDKPFEEEPGWVEYDPQSRKLSFVTENGHIHGIELNLSDEACRRLNNAETVFLMYMEGGQTLTDVKEIPVTIHENFG